jgi:hypothetical protein
MGVKLFKTILYVKAAKRTKRVDAPIIFYVKAAKRTLRVDEPQI